DRETEAVAGAVKESGGTARSVPGGVVPGGEIFHHPVVHLPPVDAGMDGGQRRLLASPDRGDQAALSVGGVAAQERARHVAVIAGGHKAGKDVDDDKVVGPERPVSVLMRITGLVAARGDGVERDAARSQAGGL